MAMFARRAALAATMAMLAAAAMPARAEIKNYEFRLVTAEVKKGDGVEVAVRLVDKTSEKPVPNAVIFAKRIDMAPDNMAAMDAPLDPLPASEPGLYRFKTNLVMAGRWQLSLAAKVHGEEGTLEARLILRALP
jgi:hypothetical protein